MNKKKTGKESSTVVRGEEDRDVLVLAERRVEITSQSDMEVAANVLGQLQGALKRVVAEKEKVTKPLWAALEAERERFRNVERNLSGAIAEVRGEMSRWQGEQVRRAAKEVEEAARLVGDGVLTVEEGLELVGEVGVGPSRRVGDGGKVGFTVRKELVVEDEGKVPREYLLVDLVRVRKVLMAGGEVPGCRLEEVQVPVTR